MIVDIVNEQSWNNNVALVLVNDSYDQDLLESVNNKVELIRIHRPANSYNPLYILRLYLELLAYRPDVIHAHNASLIRVIKYIRCKKVLTLHGTKNDFPSYYYDDYHTIFSVSEAAKNSIKFRYPQLEPKVIYNGIRFNDIPQKKKYSISPFRIVQVGRLEHKIKGQDILLRAAKEVIDKINKIKITIDFIGEDAGSRHDLVKLSNDLGISKFCRFLGRQPRKDIYHNMHLYDLLVQPSRFEGFGLTIVEAMAAKVPVLVSDIAGPMEIIGKGLYGKFFKSGSSKDCAEKIAEIISDSENENLSLSMNTIYQYAKKNYSIKITSKNYIDEYLKIKL